MWRGCGVGVEGGGNIWHLMATIVVTRTYFRIITTVEHNSRKYHNFITGNVYECAA